VISDFLCLHLAMHDVVLSVRWHTVTGLIAQPVYESDVHRDDSKYWFISTCC
jgi:hypothetical protein